MRMVLILSKWCNITGKEEYNVLEKRAALSEGYESHSSSFKASGTAIRPEVPRLFGDTGGLAMGVVGAVRVPLTVNPTRSTLEPDREGGADPKMSITSSNYIL